MKLEFKPEDFGDITEVKLRPLSDIAMLANAKLEAFIKEHGKVVSGYYDEAFECFIYGEKRQGGHTHKAVLINIEKIEPCKHEPYMESRGMVSGQGPVEVQWVETIFRSQCQHCGVKLKPTGWVEGK